MLAAVKKFNCQGVQLKAGDVITADLPAELERQLIEHRFARRIDPGQDPVAGAAVRPAGTGRGGRRTKTTTT